MRIQIIAVGRQANTPHGELVNEYIKRMQWPVQMKEITTSIQAHECTAMAKNIIGNAYVIALTPTGTVLSSEAWAKNLEKWQTLQDICFLLGGADGLNASLLQRSAQQISFGPAIWPHLLARVMLCEQLYRAQCILKNHPYHRGN